MEICNLDPQFVYGKIIEGDEKFKGKELWFELPKEMGLSKYLISTYGNVYGKIRSKNLAGFKVTSEAEYITVSLVKDESKGARVARINQLMGQVFIPNPKCMKVVLYRDLNSQNNKVENLYWAESGLHKPKVDPSIKTETAPNRKISQYTLDGVFIKEWPSKLEAAESFPVGPRYASDCIRDTCSGKRDSYNGFIWKFSDETKIAEDKWVDLHPDIGDKSLQVTITGKIKRGNRILKGTKRGLYLHTLVNKVTIPIHRLICWTFNGPPPKPDYEVNHKDLDKMNNAASNLEWVTTLDNNKHARENGASNDARSAMKRSKSVMQYNLDGTFIAEFSGAKEASLKTGTNASSIASVCTGKNNTAKGFIWKYKDS